MQRFISEDPIGFAGGDANLHAYVGNDPVNATDPSGNINPIVAACAGGAATDALTYVALSGRKSTMSGAADAAATGCITGIVGLGIGRLAFAVLPRVMAATSRGRVGGMCALPGNSFSGDTEVATESGSRRIDSIGVGDRVLAYDEETGATSYQLVTATWAHEDPIIVYVTVSGERIETTPEHPFMVVGRGWVKASDLRPGDRIHRAFGGTGPVTSVTVARQPQVMYNLTVDAAHTFFVGDDEWLVHNSTIRIPEISTPSGDWGQKGAHVKVNGVEIAIRPGQNGTIVYRRVFSQRDSESAVRAAIRVVRQAVEESARFRTDLHDATGRAITIVRTLTVKRLRGRGVELRFLQHALRQRGLCD